MQNLVGIDTGGTFTDFVCYEDGELRVHKVLSTPEAPEKAILQGLKDLAVDFNELQIIHGSTVATNAVLEGKGVKTVYVTNYGLKDVLLIGRQAREELYNLQPQQKTPLVNKDWCLETGGRLSADGEVVEDLSDAEVKKLVSQIEEIQPDAVAINLLFSFLDEKFEKKIQLALPQKLFVSRSSQVLPEYKEYERGMATWLNSYVGPLVKSYLEKLNTEVQPAKLSVMLSAGGTANTLQASNKAVNMLLSGPAGGLQAARYIGEQIDESKLLTFDMGGTSTDVALIDGQINLTNEAKINNIPVAVSMVDMHTIGAGGGSIAQVDAGGVLQVGPQSAGSNPGPACYGNGGEKVTVTDANLVMGYLPADLSLGGYLTINKQSSLNAMQQLANQLSCSIYEAADGVLKIANEHMAQALRVISVQKGLDPREYTLLSFGGAGALHVCDLAEIMGMNKALVPMYSGVLSAFGMLVAPVSRELSVTHMASLKDLTDEWIYEYLLKLRREGELEMQEEGLDLQDLSYSPSLDLRYIGQSFTLRIPWTNIVTSISTFHETHKARYGHNMEEPVELVNLRISIKGRTRSLSTKKIQKKNAAKPINKVEIHACENEVPVFKRLELGFQQVISGPAVIQEDVATTYVKPGWVCQLHELGHLQLTYCGTY